MIMFKRKKAILRYYRFGSFLENLFSSFTNIFLQINSRVIPERIFLKKTKNISLCYLNSSGQFLYSIFNFLSFLFTKKFLDKEISFDKIYDYKNTFNLEKLKKQAMAVWPLQAMHFLEDDAPKIKYSSEYLNSLYKANVEDFASKIVSSNWWIDCIKEFRDFFYNDNEIDLEKLS